MSDLNKAASDMGKKRWKGKTKAEKLAFAMKGVEARKRNAKARKAVTK